jgi:hypothetical protein
MGSIFNLHPWFRPSNGRSAAKTAQRMSRADGGVNGRSHPILNPRRLPALHHAAIRLPLLRRAENAPLSPG